MESMLTIRYKGRINTRCRFGLGPLNANISIWYTVDQILPVEEDESQCVLDLRNIEDIFRELQDSVYSTTSEELCQLVATRIVEEMNPLYTVTGAVRVKGRGEGHGKVEVTFKFSTVANQ